MDVLVTGGCGYIGSRLVPMLDDDERVDRGVVLDDLSTGSPRTLMGSLTETVQFRQGDVREYGDVEGAMRDCDAVVHLAAITGAASTQGRREETFAVNYDGTENVLTAAGKFDIDSVAFASSCNLYGRATSRDLDETVEADPINPYAETKLESEALVREAAAEFGFDATCLRMATNYGDAPGIRFNLVVNAFVFRAVTGRPLTVYGDGSNWRPYIHVEDAARAYAQAALDPGRFDHLVYNVGSNDGNYRLDDLAELVADEVGPVDIAYLEERHPGPSYHVNFDRIERTGFEPSRTLREGVRELADAFRPGSAARPSTEGTTDE